MATSATNSLVTTTKIAKGFLEAFESNRVLSKTVNTQKLDGKFNPSTGSTTEFKRPTDYASTRSSGGDISSGTRQPIVVGKAQGVVQDYFTVDVDFDEVEESLQLDQLDLLLAPMAQRIVTDLELDFGAFMLKNLNLSVGDPGTSVTAWSEVAQAGALMKSVGVPGDGGWNYIANPFTEIALAGVQYAVPDGGSMVSEAFRNATIRSNFAGMNVMTSDALSTYTGSALTAGANRAGILSSNPDVTYLTAKDTMTQALPVSGFGAGSDVIKAGEIVEITGRYRNSLSTRQQIVGEAGAAIKWRATVTADVTLSGGAGTLVVSGPAIYEAAGAFNTTSSAIVQNDVVTLLGAASAVNQPNMFFHKDAFSIGSVPIKKLYSTDTLATTKDGLQFRVSKYADGDANKQICRIDFHPAYAALNPFFAGQGFGNA